MEKLLLILVAGVLALGGRHYHIHLKNKRKRKLTEGKLAVWGGEGGAVPVAPERIAAQVAPRKPASTSP